MYIISLCIKIKPICSQNIPVVLCSIENVRFGLNGNCWCV